MTHRPPATLSLDLDNKWSYLKIHGDSGWEGLPSYLDVVVPRVLRVLEELGLRITCFVVGQDAALERNREALAAIAASGHEIGNHSFAHESWLHLYTREEIEADIGRAEAHILEATGRKPVGFRGPGFSCSPETLRALAGRGYLYDASTFPSCIGPLARAYYFMTAELSREELRRRSLLFGRFRDGFRPLKPYLWNLGGETLVEIPVTTLPAFRLPFHLSYLLYLARLSPALALGYFQAALTLCRLTGTPPSILLHPLDFLGCDDTSDLDFFPAMDVPGRKKTGLVRASLLALCERFNVMTLQEYARQTAWQAGATRMRVPTDTGYRQTAVPS